MNAWYERKFKLGLFFFLSRLAFFILALLCAITNPKLVRVKGFSNSTSKRILELSSFSFSSLAKHAKLFGLNRKNGQ